MTALYVGNLDPECTEAFLYRKFAPVGNLLNIRICRDKKSGRCLGYGFVHFASKSEAQAALNTLNYTSLKGRTIRLMWADKNIKKLLPPDANVFVKNLNFSIDEKSLHDLFANYGNILSLKLEKNEDGNSKGFAFVQYEDEKSAKEAIKYLNQKMIRGKIVHVTKFLPKEKRVATHHILPFQNVYIKNFGPGVSDKDLIQMCEKFGDIVSAKVMLDDEGNSRGFGFVCFEDPASAKEAVKELNNKVFNGRCLYADRAKKKSERQKEVMENFKRKVEKCGWNLPASE